MTRLRSSLVIFFVCTGIVCTEGFGAEVPLAAKNLPPIPSLSSRDSVFRQYSDDVETNYKNRAAGKNINYQFYAYNATTDDSLFSIAARCVIPYETIATLNNIANIDEPLAGQTLILPTFAGIFVCEEPKSSIEILVQKKYALTLANEPEICYNINGRRFYFLADERFSPTERAYFLDAEFRMPLDSAWLSSAYGMRVSPITGDMRFHSGIDLAAPEGTVVRACKSGEVIRRIAGNAVYGNCLVLRHANGVTSFYAHLSQIEVNEGDIVRGGTEIGRVGQTGAATGPHLHFEIRVNGVSADPQRFLQ